MQSSYWTLGPWEGPKRKGGLVDNKSSAQVHAASSMLIVHVHVQVLLDRLEEFKEATVANARRSLEEPGVARFDVVQQQDDPTRFVLVEAYQSSIDADAHKETEHYRLWREAVAPMMAESRFRVEYSNIFPHSESW